MAAKQGFFKFRGEILRYLSFFMIFFFCGSLAANDLFEATKSGDINAVKKQLNKVKVDKRGKYGSSALMVASYLGHEDIVNLLIKKGARINFVNKMGSTPLLEAAKKGHTGIAKTLLSSGAKINKADKNGQTALHFAAMRGFKGLYKYLIKKGANRNKKDRKGKKASNYLGSEEEVEAIPEPGPDLKISDRKLVELVKAGRCSKLERLLDEGLDSNHSFRNGSSLLMLAAYLGKKECLQVLLDAGAEVNYIASTYKNTPLMEAAKTGRLGILKTLIRNGANHKVKDYRRRTARDFALLKKRPRSAAFLKNPRLKAKKDRPVDDEVDEGPPEEPDDGPKKPVLTPFDEINNQGHHGWTLLMSAAAKGDLRKIKSLIKKNANLKLKNERGHNALHIALINNKIKVVSYLLKKQNAKEKDSHGDNYLHFCLKRDLGKMAKFLIKKKLGLFALDNKKRSPLILASLGGMEKIVKSLLKKGAKINRLDIGKNTALMGASFKGHQRVASLLISKGAKLNLKNKYGKTALILAASHNFPSVVQILVNAGAKRKIKDKKGKTALKIARNEGFKRVVEVLEAPASNVKARYKVDPLIPTNWDKELDPKSKP